MNNLSFNGIKWIFTRQKWGLCPSAGLLIIILLLAACTRSASRGPAPTITPGMVYVSVDRVQVNQGTGIYIAGQSNVPAGQCIQTELLAAGEPVSWWPDECIEVGDSRWEILVSLGRGDAPARLETGIAYTLHAWWPGSPADASTRFPFDLDEPKQP